MDEPSFVQLLEAITSPQNEARNAAEQRFEQLKNSDPVFTMHALVELCARGAHSVQMISLILLRKMFATNVDVFDKAPADVKAAIMEKTLVVFANAAHDRQQAKSAAALVAALAVKIIKLDGSWDELWTNLFATILNPGSSSEHKAACCDVLAHTATVVATSYIRDHPQEVATGLLNCLKDPETVTKLASINAVQQIIGMIAADRISLF